MKSYMLAGIALAVVVSVLVIGSPIAAQCTPEWANGLFPLQGVRDGVSDLCVYNGELYAAGPIVGAGTAAANHIAAWNGSKWHDVGGGLAYWGAMAHEVNALCVYNGELYAGGFFTAAGGIPANNIAKWNGTSWQTLGSGTNGEISAMCVHNGKLYVGGSFTTAGGLAVQGLARWNGSSWETVGRGYSGVSDMCAYDGSLYLAAWTDQYMGPPISSVTKYDGSSWSEIGGWYGDGMAYSLCVHDGNLYVGGEFTSIGGVGARCVARWNGASWQAVVGGISDSFAWITTLGSANGKLYAYGDYTTPTGSGLHCFAVWDGAWETLDTGMSATVYDVCSFSGDTYVAGAFSELCDVTATGIIKSNGSGWKGVGEGANSGMSALLVHDGKLLVGGSFTAVGNVSANRAATWNGANWQALGTGMNDSVASLCVYNGVIHAGGTFTTAGGSANRIAGWNGTTWEALGGGVSGGSNPSVNAMCAYGGELYVGGKFTSAGGTTVNGLARWNGTNWQAVGTGLGGSCTVYAMCVYGGELYVAGYFTTAGGVAVKHIAKWNGALWQDVGGGFSGQNAYIASLCVYNGALYAGGNFTSAGSAPATRIARWDGAAWQSVGAGIGGSGGLSVNALCVHGGDLYVGGQFQSAGGAPAYNLAKWNGASWQAISGCSFGPVSAVCEYDDGLGSQPALYACSIQFTTTNGLSAYIGRWGCESTLNGMASAKAAPDGRLVTIDEDVSTAVFGDAFYLSHVINGLQVSGIRAEMAGHGMIRNKLMGVIGRTRTTSYGERYIDAWGACMVEPASAKPVAMSPKALGGGASASGQPAITGAYGLNNVGMLLRVSGKISYIDEHNFTLDDGGGVDVHCVTPDAVAVDPLWRFVTVTGISSCERVGEELYRRLLVRDSDDVVVVVP